MPSYHTTVPMPRRSLSKQYHPSLLRQSPQQLEDYLNERARNSPEIALTFFEIAHDTGINGEIVKLFLKALTGHDSGITVGNPELKREPDT